ncbi:MAG: stage II sporulation protein M [Deltaproteobacteria bacterium]|nr:stage II sporulation protein M [Deltaproteobacteria bacterium]
MNLKVMLGEAISAARRRKNLIVFFIATHVVFLVFGEWMVAKEFPGVLFLRAEQLKEIQNLPYLKPLTGILADNLALKILYTFFFNLIFGAFLSTTVTGVVFVLPYLIAVWRSFIIGILIYNMDVSPALITVFYGTFVLEFGAYCVSSAIGMDLGLSVVWPGRKGTRSRREAFSLAARDGARLYLLVIIILFIAAIWEMSWLHYLGPLKLPDNIN